MDGLIAYILCKGYTDEKIAGLGNVFNYKGVVQSYSDLPITGNKKGDVWTVRDSGSEYVWVDVPNEHWELLGSAIGTGKYSTIINGDGTTTVFQITHNLASRDIATIVYNAAAYNEIIVDITHTSENVITLEFDEAPAVGENYVVSCLIPQGPQGPKGDKGSEVSVNAIGTSTNEVNYITIDGVESKLAGGSDVSVSPTGTSSTIVRYITIDGVETKFACDTLRAMPSSWCGSNLTTEQAVEKMFEDGVKPGEGYLGGVEWSDLSTLGLGNAEVKAFVINDWIIQFELTSSDTEPYAWFFNSAAGQWRSYVPIYNGVDSTSITSALSANMGKNL